MGTVWMDLSTEGVLTEHDTKGTLSDYQAVVGGWIEAVTMRDFTVYVNEEGLLIGLPFNQGASQITGRPLVGNACIVGNPDQWGNTRKLSASAADRIRFAITGK